MLMPAWPCLSPLCRLLSVREPSFATPSSFSGRQLADSIGAFSPGHANVVLGVRRLAAAIVIFNQILPPAAFGFTLLFAADYVSYSISTEIMLM